MPVYTLKLTRMLSSACGTTITGELQRGLDQLAQADGDAVLDFGIDFAVEQCRGLLKKGVAGLHFYTMDRSKSTTAIVHPEPIFFRRFSTCSYGGLSGSVPG